MAASTNDNKDNKNKLQYTYKANITLGDITLDGISFLGLTEVYDYMGNLYPLKVLMININLLDTNSKMFMNLKNREVIVKMSLIRVETSLLPATDPEYTRKEYEVFSEKQFTGTVDEEFIPLTDLEVVSIKKNEDAPREDMMHMVRIHLKEQFLNPFVEDIFNMVTDSDTDLPSVVCAAFMKCAAPGLKLNMMTPNSTVKIPENTLIEPMGFLQLLEYLQKNYGMYYYGYTVFIQDDTVYIISKEGFNNKNEADYIISTIPMTSVNNVNVGFNPAKDGNIITVDASKIGITDVHNEYYNNYLTKIDEDGTVHNPLYKEKNVSLIVDNDNLVQSVYDNTNMKTKLRDFNAVCQNTYIDINPSTMFQIETPDMVFSKLSILGYHRVVSPIGSVVNLNLYQRT